MESSNNNFSLSNDKDSFIYDTSTDSVLNTSNGNDTLVGKIGSDTLNAGSGDDLLDGGAGNDTLIGGTGNYLLKGGVGSDTYVFSKGHGQDVIIDDGNASDVDQIKFTDVTSTDVKFQKQGDDLILFGYHADDSIRITDFFYTPWQRQIESFTFSDHQSLDGSYLNQYKNSANQMIDAMAGFHSTSDQLNTTEERTLKPVSLSTSSV